MALGALSSGLRLLSDPEMVTTVETSRREEGRGHIPVFCRARLL